MEARWYQHDAIQSIYQIIAAKGPTCAPLIALPTGTGKGFVIAEFIRQVFMNAPRTRVMMATHVKELIKQNAKKLLEVWPIAPLGIYSAGLKMREQGMPITFAGIQSAYKKTELFGHIDILVIDEAHLLSPGDATMYQQLIRKLRAINPNLVVIGLTATAYRMGQGMLTEGDGIFTDISYDMTDIKGFNRLVAEGFLAPLYPKKTDTVLDVSNVSMNNGEFSKGELEKAVDKDEITRKCLAEVCYYGNDKEHWMLFASGIHHAERIAEILRTEFGVSAGAIHSGNDDELNAKMIKAFESGEMRAAVNMNKMTTGYDFAPIDLIGHLRPTNSTGLWVQMNGRGTRPSPETGKDHCLALDFAGNTRRLGPINDPFIPKAKGSGGGDAPVRLCSICGIYNPASARTCYCCGHEFTFQEKLLQTAGTDELIVSDAPIVETYSIKRVMYSKHQKEGKKPYIRVAYHCGVKQFSEFVFLDNVGYPAHKSRDWWRMRNAIEPPTPETCHPFSSATDAALSIIQTLKVPSAVRVWTNKKPYPEVQSVEF